MRLLSGSSRPTREESLPEFLPQVLLTYPDSIVGGATSWRGGLLGEDSSTPAPEALSCPMGFMEHATPTGNRCRSLLSAVALPGPPKNPAHTQWGWHLVSPVEGEMTSSCPSRCSGPPRESFQNARPPATLSGK